MTIIAIGLQFLKYVKEEQQRPIIVSGPRGAGGSFVRSFISGPFRPPRTDVEWFNVGEMRNPIESMDTQIGWLRGMKNDNSLLIVLDDAEVLPASQLETIVRRLFNWKRIRNVVIITTDSNLKLPRAHNLLAELPTGKLYGLPHQLIAPQREIISVVASGLARLP